jgi:predicted GNAT family acetyltransferase
MAPMLAPDGHLRSAWVDRRRMGRWEAMAIELRHDEERSRYELCHDGEVVAFTEHTPAGDGVWEFAHTYTEPAHRGHGHAAQVVAFAMDDVHSRGLRVRPSCWFVSDYLAAHPELADLRA